MMSDNEKPVMLCLEPKELVFEGPFNRLLNKNLVISNKSMSQIVAFKLKTTTPNIFAVRPCVGILRPNENVTVDFFLKPLDSDAGQKRTIFLIQAAVVSDNVTDLQKFWRMPNLTIWKAHFKCELVPHKSSDQHFRQAGGDTTGSQRSKQDSKAHGRSWTSIAAFALIIVTAIGGAFYGKHYLCMKHSEADTCLTEIDH